MSEESIVTLVAAFIGLAGAFGAVLLGQWLDRRQNSSASTKELTSAAGRPGRGWVRWLAGLVVGIIVGALLATLYFQVAPLPQHTTVDRFEVRANVERNLVGSLPLQPGDRMRITWVEGEWTGDSARQPYTSGCGFPWVDSNDSHVYPLPTDESGGGALIAYVGNAPIMVGCEPFTTVSTASGSLYLGMNDCDGCFGDNQGSLFVRLSIERRVPVATATLGPTPVATATLGPTAVASSTLVPTAVASATPGPTASQPSPTASPPTFAFRALSIETLSDFPDRRPNLQLQPGETLLGGIPFDVGWTASTRCAYNKQSRSDILELQVDTLVSDVYVLFQAGWALDQYASQRIGSIELEYFDENVDAVALVLGHNIRDWSIQHAEAVSTVDDPNVFEVWRGTAPDGTQGRMDVMHIPAAADRQLRAIVIRDESETSVSSVDPCIHILGVTILGS